MEQWSQQWRCLHARCWYSDLYGNRHGWEWLREHRSGCSDGKSKSNANDQWSEYLLYRHFFNLVHIGTLQWLPVVKYGGYTHGECFGWLVYRNNPRSQRMSGNFADICG